MVVDGQDTRSIRFDLGAAPYGAIALIQTYYNDFPNTVGYGTGFLIGQGRLASAAHVFWNDLGGTVADLRLPDSVKVFVGDGLFQNHPELAFEIQVPSPSLRVHPGFRAGDLTCDMATLDLPTALAGALPVLGFPADLTPGEVLTISGYPIDLAPFGEYEGTGPLADIGAPVFDHQVDTSEGQSGAPVRVQRGGTWQVVGIHLGDADPGADGAERNRALALTRPATTWLHGS